MRGRAISPCHDRSPEGFVKRTPNWRPPQPPQTLSAADQQVKKKQKICRSMPTPTPEDQYLPRPRPDPSGFIPPACRLFACLIPRTQDLRPVSRALTFRIPQSTIRNRNDPQSEFRNPQSERSAFRIPHSEIGCPPAVSRPALPGPRHAPTVTGRAGGTAGRHARASDRIIHSPQWPTLHSYGDGASTLLVSA